MDMEKLKEVNAESPCYTIGQIPAGYVDSLKEPVNTLVIGCVFMVKDTMDEELVYNITKSMFEHKDELDAIHAAWKDTNEKTAAVNCPGSRCTRAPSATTRRPGSISASCHKRWSSAGTIRGPGLRRAGNPPPAGGGKPGD